MSRAALKRSPSLGMLGGGMNNSSSISTIETPSPMNANTLNRPAQASQSMYQLSLELLERLCCVDGFEAYLQNAARNGSVVGTPSSETPPSGILQSDPVTLLWRTFRLGYPLCALFNAMQPAKPIADEWVNPPQAKPGGPQPSDNEGKKSLYHFLVGCRTELGLAEDEMFSLSSVYKDDTNGLVKIIKTVKRVVDKLEEKGLLDLGRRQLLRNSDETKPTDNRARVVHELLETERKYVQDMEALQNFARELQNQEIVSRDTIYHLFANLDQLVDFQRRFLIWVESNASLPPNDQRFGNIFVQMEENFAVYEPFCANYQSASELVIKEAPSLQKLSQIVEVTYELPSLLIKPIQRICKYPLLMQELLKCTEPDTPYYSELESGLQAIKRVADRVNETRRKQENESIVKDLSGRVENWKGHNIQDFGELLLENVFVTSKDDSEREYHVYLFERILLCCKEINQKRPQKNQKRPPKRTSLQLKGRIFIHNITAVRDNSGPGVWSLKVYWKGEAEMESFSLKCRNEEQLKQWFNTLEKLHRDSNNRRTMQLSGAKGYEADNRSTRTPVSKTQLVSLQNLDIPQARKEYEEDNASHLSEDDGDDDQFDDEDDFDDWAVNKSSSKTHQSLPYGQISYNNRPLPRRAETWRSPSPPPVPHMPQQPHYSLPYNQYVTTRHVPGQPPLPRYVNANAQYPDRFAQGAPTNEYGVSSNHNPYFPASPPISHTTSPSQSARSSSSVQSQNVSIWQRQSVDHPSHLADTLAKFMMTPEDDEYVVPPMMQRAHSHSAGSGQTFQQLNGPPPPVLPSTTTAGLTRLRSQSSPNIHSIQELSWENADATPEVPAIPPLTRVHANGQHAAATSPSTGAPQRDSGSSTSSAQSTHVVAHVTSNSTSSVNNDYQLNGNGHGHFYSASTASNASSVSLTSMKIKVNFVNDIFVIVVPSDIPYRELCNRVERKIRLCSVPRDESTPLRIKYQDEDGDYITINSDEDVQLAFEGRLQAGGNFVNLYVS